MNRQAYSLRFPQNMRFAVELAKVFNHRLPVTIAIGAFLYVLLAAWLLYLTSHLVYAGLLTAMTLLSVVRTGSLLRHRRQPTHENNVQTRLRLMALYSGISGVLWGSLGYIGIAESQYGITLVLTVFLTGVIAASTAALSHVPPAHLAFVVTATTPIAWVYAADTDTHRAVIGALLLVYLGLMYLYSCGIRAVAFDAIDTRIKNDDLVRELADENHRTAMALRKAEEASRAKSTFLAAASHDLRQPMQSLRLLCESLSIHARETPSEKIARDIDTSVSTLQGLFDALLDISRLEAGAIDIEKKAFPLQQLIDRLDTDARPLAGERGLTLVMPDTREWVYTDPVLLERIVRNILSNALQYTENGEVRLCIESPQDCVILHVQDTGKGIPVSDQARVFDEFVQLDNPGRDRSRGQGLGLAIVARLSALLALKVSLHSTVGVGTDLAISIPRSLQHQTASLTPQRTGRFESLEGLTVAVVEDAANTREAFDMLLDAWGCSVVSASDSESILAAVDQSATMPDVVIADFQLTGETGIDAIEALRRRLGRPLPALIISGDVTLGTTVPSADGDVPVMRKPSDSVQLNAFLHRVLTTRNASRGDITTPA